jgi:hypothetical protein
LTMPKRMPGPLPHPGQIVGCHFPRDDQPERPGDKFRPAFVMGTDDTFGQDFPRVCLAYGTGQKTSDKLAQQPPKAHQFELDKGEDGNRLAEQTRFDCAQHVWLPFTEDWFKPPIGPGICVAGYGSVPSARTDEIRSAAEAGKEKAKEKAKANVAPIVIVKPAPKLKSASTLSLKKGQPGASDT